MIHLIYCSLTEERDKYLELLESIGISVLIANQFNSKELYVFHKKFYKLHFLNIENKFD